MTVGTSPRPGRALSGASTAFARNFERFNTLRLGWLARVAAGLHLGGLGILLMTAWRDADPVAGTTIAGLPALHLGFLMLTGAAAAALTLMDRDALADKAEPAGNADGLRDLMAQMSHELRTPLNAVIGFSEVMLRELHGPLGHARYQEYAHHISESGGRMLKSSEDALAVTEAMSALIADRMHGRRERVMAGSLVREAWKSVAAAVEPADLRLTTTACNACELTCERRAVVQAFEHLLREAATHAPAGSTIEVKGRRRGSARSIELRVSGYKAPAEAVGPGSLRVILARLLLGTQGATLTTTVDLADCWSALIEFTPRG
jgi:signal transduction histidine kinase